MTFWRYLDIKAKPSPFKDGLLQYADLLNSNTVFALKQLDFNWYEYEPALLQIDRPVLMRYRRQNSLAGINRSGLHERVLFREENGSYLPADCGNELIWNTMLENCTVSEGEVCNARKITSSFLYAGIFYYSFGHFILENLPRLWLISKCLRSRDELVFVNLFEEEKSTNTFERIIKASPNYKSYLSSLGISALIKQVPREGVKGYTCKVCAPTVSLTQTGLHISTACRQAWKDINTIMSSSIASETNVMLYFTRSKVKSPYLGRELVNEISVENVFRSFGFRVICSEDLIEEYGPEAAENHKQALLRDANVVAGTAGSNLLNHVFCKERTKVIAITNMFVISHQRSGALTHSVYFADYLHQDIRVYVEDSTDARWECSIDKLKDFLRENL